MFRYNRLNPIIDEYENFTNTVLNEQGEKVYWAITHADGFYRDVFKKFKGMFERIFITGVPNNNVRKLYNDCLLEQ